MKTIKRMTVYYLDGSVDTFDETDNPEGYQDRLGIHKDDWLTYQYIGNDAKTLRLDTFRTITNIPMSSVKKLHIDEKE